MSSLLNLHFCWHKKWMNVENFSTLEDCLLSRHWDFFCSCLSVWNWGSFIALYPRHRQYSGQALTSRQGLLHLNGWVVFGDLRSLSRVGLCYVTKNGQVVWQILFHLSRWVLRSQLKGTMVKSLAWSDLLHSTAGEMTDLGSRNLPLMAYLRQQ